MKTGLFLSPLVIVCFVLTQLQAPAQIAPSGLSSTYSIVSRGPNDRVWARINLATSALGEVITNVSSYEEIATGLHYLQNGQWQESQELIESYPDGAIAQYGQHKVIFANNLNTTGAIDLQTPDGKELRSRIMGLSYFDGVTGQSVLIAETTNSLGALTKNNEVVYPNAFDDVAADIQYVYTRAGLEQNVVLRASLPSPAGFELDPATTRLQVLTEFFSPPTPAIKSTVEADGGVDEYLNFGVMQIGKGRAFSVGGASEANTLIAVRKQWTVLDNRTFLVEEVPFEQVEQQIESLGTKGGGASLDKNRRGQGVNVIAALKDVLPKQGAVRRPRPMRLAKVEEQQQPGFVLDYTILSSQTNFSFAANTNYFVTGLVNLSGTNNVLEGGCVIKFTNSSSAEIKILSGLTSKCDSYRPAVFTSMNDDTVGETISGSTGDPTTNYCGNPALYFAYAPATLSHVRFSYARAGVVFEGSSGHVLSDAQFIHCADALQPYYCDCTLRNVLVYGVSNVVSSYDGSTVRGEHWTVHQANNLSYSDYADVYLTNSLLVEVTNTAYLHGTVVSNLSSDSRVFQTVGAGSHYLYNDTYRNKGTTNISASLLAELKKETTYPPYEITTNITGDTVLSVQASRDTNSAPDLGYHYDPLDFVVSGRSVSGCTLTLTNGVALGTYGNSSSYGISIDQGGNLVSQGTASNLNQIVRYNTVQEQATTNWSASTVGDSVEITDETAPLPTARFWFTDWMMLGGRGYHLDASYSGSTIPLAFRDCRFGPGSFNATYCAAAFTNCLLERVNVKLDDDGGNFSYYGFNNLLYGGSLTLQRNGSSPWVFRDNLFDATAISQSGTITHDHNGYVTNQNRLTPNGSDDVILTNTPVFQTGNLGNYYYPTNDGMLSTLIDAGSRTVGEAGLGGYTVQTNNAWDACMVDIGFHYYAGASGDLSVSTNYTALELVKLLVPVSAWDSISNATNIGAVEARGVFTNGFLAGFPLNYGVILSTGYITNAIGPNNDSGFTAGGAGTNYPNGPSNLGQHDDSDLNQLVGTDPKYDAAVLEFDITPTNSFTLQFRYIFASEEYPEYIGNENSGYNDPMAIFVTTNEDGANWVCNVTNDLAVVPGLTNVPISVNNINGGYTNSYSGAHVAPTNVQYYVDNHDPDNQDSPNLTYSSVPPYAAPVPVYNLQYDGFTTLQTVQTNLSAHVTYHIKIAIEDYLDPVWDSAVFIESPCQNQ
jgi:hypothetical protein